MDTPVREFHVYYAISQFEPVVIEGTLPKVSDNGTLEILRDVGGTLWTVAIFPAGSYSRLECDPPTDELVEAFAAIRTQRTRDAQLKQELSLPSGLPGGRIVQ